MMTLRQLAAEPPTIPTRAGWYLADLGEAKGKHELFTRQSPRRRVNRVRCFDLREDVFASEHYPRQSALISGSASAASRRGVFAFKPDNFPCRRGLIPAARR